MSVVANVAINVDGRQAVNELNKVESATNQLNQGFNALKSAAAALAGALIVKSIADVGAQSQQTKLQLQSLTQQYGELEKATASVDRIQKILGISAIEAREGYAQLYAALRGTGVSAEQLEVLFVGLTKAARMSGAGAAEAQGALLQLKQAFASGTLSGDELRSVLEAMPALTQAVAKETDRLGLTSNATSADIKRLGSQGKLTSDILFAAARNIALSNTRQLTSSEALSAAYKNLQERIAEAFGPALVSIVETFAAAIGALGRYIESNKESITSVVNAIINFAKAVGPLAAGIWLVIKAYQAWAVVSKALAATQAFIAALTGPKGIALVAAAGVAAFGAYQTLNGVLKGTEAELKKQSEESKKAGDEFGRIAQNVGELPNKSKAAAEANKVFTDGTKQALDNITAQRIEIDAQIASLTRGASITAARYEAEKAILDLRNQELEREYNLAQTAEQRLNIAAAIFQNQVQAAEVEYRQALENITLEQRKVELQLQQEQLKYRQIEAEGKLQILKAKDAAEEAEKARKLKDALATQEQVISATRENLGAQQQIAAYQKQAAETQYQSKVLTAQTGLEQKLVSDKIGLSQEQATRLSNELANGAIRSHELANNTERVSQNAYNASGNFIRVANAADRAATAIHGAANAQERLNAAQGGGGGGAPKQAAEGAYWSGGFKAFAEGGVVTKPTMGIVGEGGEPEYIIPASKMAEAMQRYAAGQRGSSVIPSSINPQVSVTTGPVMNMGGTNFVSQQDFMMGMQTASRRGAEMAIQLLQGNNSVRRRAGVA